MQIECESHAAYRNWVQVQTLALNQFHLSIFDWIACVLLCDCIIYDVVLDARCSMLNTFGFDFFTLWTNWEKNQLKLVIKRYEIKLLN